MPSQILEINVSAPGKVILHGEHAVVYGKAAIAANLNLRCQFKLKRMQDSFVTLDLPDVGIFRQFPVASIHEGLQNIETSGSIQEPSAATPETILAIKKFAGIDEENTDTKQLAVAAFLYIYYCIFKKESVLPSVSIHMTSELPVGAGLGSSAAYSVSLAAALLQFAGHIDSEKVEEGVSTWKSADKSIINKWAFIGEKVIHGRPSGIDNSISTYGGALRFQKGEITHIDKMPTLFVMLVNTKVPRSTMTLVANFRQKYNTYQDIFDPVLNAVEAITERAEEKYTSIHDNPKPEDYKTVGDLMDLNHQLLNMMGVGHPSLDQIVTVAKSHGLHAKLTGAGGGGCAFILVPPGIQDSVLDTAKKDLEDLGFEVWPKISVGGHGVLRKL